MATAWPSTPTTLCSGRKRQTGRSRTIRLADRPVGLLLATQHRIADALVLSKIRDRFGGRIRFHPAGSAPLDHELARLFHAVGILVLEGYGLTYKPSCPPHS